MVYVKSTVLASWVLIWEALLNPENKQNKERRMLRESISVLLSKPTKIQPLMNKNDNKLFQMHNHLGYLVNSKLLKSSSIYTLAANLQRK